MTGIGLKTSSGTIFLVKVRDDYYEAVLGRLHLHLMYKNEQWKCRIILYSDDCSGFDGNYLNILGEGGTVVEAYNAAVIKIHAFLAPVVRLSTAY